MVSLENVRRAVARTPGLAELVRAVPELRRQEGRLKILAALTAGYGGALASLRRFNRFGPYGIVTGQALAYFALWRLGRRLFAPDSPSRQQASADVLFEAALPALGAHAALLYHIAEAPPGRRLPKWLAWAPAVYLLPTGAALIVRSWRERGLEVTPLGEVIRAPGWAPPGAGMHRRVRHPFEGGVARIALGMALARRNLTGVALAAAYAVWLRVWTAMQERERLARYGRAYEGYRAATPALTPTTARGEAELLRDLAPSPGTHLAGRRPEDRTPV